jgi:hypothetical protein
MRVNMAVTNAELKTLLVAEVGAAEYADEIDEVWELWLKQETNPNARAFELLMRKRLLRFLQGKYRTRYNVTVGTERREAFQMFQAVSGMLKECEDDIEQLGLDTPTLGATGMKQNMAACSNGRFRHGKGR